jgi:hypothetical protein
MRVPARLLPGLVPICAALAAACSEGTSSPTSPSSSSNRSVTINAPAATSPANGETIASDTPTLVAANSTVAEAAPMLRYRFEVATDAAFSTVVALWEMEQTGGTTITVVGQPLPGGTEYHWRVSATDGTTVSTYSSPQSFKTPAAAVVEAPSVERNWPNNGLALIAWASSNYPDRLSPAGSLGQRQDNMAFLRDRMIEAGLCGGMQLGWNMKRGGPEVSIDYLTVHDGGRWIGVDIGHDYGDLGDSLHLTWAPMPDDPYASHADYPNPLPCR